MFMNVYIGAYVFIIGLLIGSFLNVCIYRIPKGESIAYPPSHCTQCGNRIKWYDLVPVISYLALGRKCRYCGEKISIRYMIIELGTGVLFLLLYLQYGISFVFFKYIIFTTFLIVIGMIDFDTTDVYFKTTLSAAITGVILVAVGYFTGEYLIKGMLTYLYGAVFGGGLIALIILLTHGMGWGDAEICFFCGLFLGLKNTILMMFLSFVIGGTIGIILIALKKKSKKDYIPFGPSIALAAIMVALYGNSIINRYLNMF